MKLWPGLTCQEAFCNCHRRSRLYGKPASGNVQYVSSVHVGVHGKKHRLGKGILFRNSFLIRLKRVWDFPRIYFGDPPSKSDKIYTNQLLKGVPVVLCLEVLTVQAQWRTPPSPFPQCQCPARVDIECSRSEKWKINLFPFFQVKSEMKIWFTHFENEKWNENASESRSRMKSL